MVVMKWNKDKMEMEAIAAKDPSLSLGTKPMGGGRQDEEEGGQEEEVAAGCHGAYDCKALQDHR